MVTTGEDGRSWTGLAVSTGAAPRCSLSDDGLVVTFQALHFIERISVVVLPEKIAFYKRMFERFGHPTYQQNMLVLEAALEAAGTPRKSADTLG